MKPQVIEPQAKPYSVLATIYDYVMSHVDYAMWAKYIKTLFPLASRPVVRIVDLSCGTGSLLSYLSQRGKQIFGFDLALDMLQTAQKKYPDMCLTCSDFTALPLKSRTVDVALSLYDSVNYLMTEAEVMKFFAESYRILKKGGLLIFDVVTPYLCENVFKEYHEQAEVSPNLRYERFSFYKRKESLQVNRFKIWINGRVYYEEHQQKIREIKDWVRLISRSNFKIIEIFSNFSRRPVIETSERAHFVLKRMF